MGAKKKLRISLWEKFKRSWASALLGAIGALATVIISIQPIINHIDNFVTNTLSNEFLISKSNFKNLSMQVKNDVGMIRNDIDRLSTNEIRNRIDELDFRLQNLAGQLRSLQQIISPSNASEILTVAKMKDEIFARNKFEERIKNTVKTSTNQLESASNRIDNLQYWIWGTLITLIGGLFGTTIFLGKKLANITTDSSQPQIQADAGGSNNRLETDALKQNSSSHLDR